MTSKPQTFKTFTTEPQKRRHISPWSISGNRLRDFMETLFRKGLKNCSHGTLLFEAQNFFETNDSRTIDRYIGRPPNVKRYPGSNVVRVNRQSSKIARFDYMNERRIEAKKGLLEILGYATREEGRYILHHERMSYYSKQASINDLCARHIGDVEAITPKGRGKVGEPFLEVPLKDTRERERSYRQHTHKSVLLSETTEKHTVLQLTPLESAILRVATQPNNPEEPDRAKVSWGKQEPIIPEQEPEDTSAQHTDEPLPEEDS
jgi:hypothetical protein